MVEVAQNDLDTLVLLAQHVLGGDLDVVECHESCTSCCRVRGLDLLGLNTLATLDKEDTQAFVGSGTCNEVIAPYTVGDPLLGTVDDLGSLCERFIFHLQAAIDLHSACHRVSSQQLCVIQRHLNQQRPR